MEVKCGWEAGGEGVTVVEVSRRDEDVANRARAVADVSMAVGGRAHRAMVVAEK
jgi:hypothetical protein